LGFFVIVHSVERKRSEQSSRRTKVLAQPVVNPSGESERDGWTGWFHIKKSSFRIVEVVDAAARQKFSLQGIAFRIMQCRV
jgi:hypothetical protein